MRCHVERCHGFQKKIAMITGAASGIGAGTAAVFAERGARLVLVDRDSVGLKAATRAMPVAPGRVVTYAGDLADPETARGAERLAREVFGGPMSSSTSPG